MYQYDDPTCVPVMPTPAASGIPGWFTDGSAAGQEPATILRADFMNALQAELLAILAAANIVPDKTQQNQILAAIDDLIDAGVAAQLTAALKPYAPTASPTFTGTVTLPNAPASDNTLKAATTAWVWSNIQALVTNCISAVASAAGFACSFGTNGYVKFPSWLGGWILQYGATTVSGPVTTLVNFPNACRAAFPASSNASTVTSVTVSGSTITLANVSGNVYWFAIGN